MCRTLDAWLDRMDSNMTVVQPILVKTYGRSWFRFLLFHFCCYCINIHKLNPYFPGIVCGPIEQRVINRKRQMSSLFIKQRVINRKRQMSSLFIEQRVILRGKGKGRHYSSALRCVLSLAILFYFKLIERGREFRGPVQESFIYKNYLPTDGSNSAAVIAGPSSAKHKPHTNF